MRRILYLISCLLLVLNTGVSGQYRTTDSIPPEGTFHLSTSYHRGYLLPHHRQITYYIEDNINGFDIMVSKYLQHVNPGRNPEVGAGYYFSNLANKDIYGTTHGFYAYVGEDYYLWGIPVEFHPSLAFGFSYLPKQFDIVENYENRTIGSSINAFIILSLKARIDINDDFTLFGGPAMVHMSNGNSKQPNLGINLITTRFGMTYNFRSEKLQKLGDGLLPSSDPIAKLSGKDRIAITLAGGIRQVSRKIPDNYLVGSLVMDYSRKVFRYFAIGAGFDFVKDPVEGVEVYSGSESISDYDPWHVGAHLSLERIWNRFSLFGQPGYKIYTQSEHKSYQFNRAGVRYRFDNGFTVSAAIKSHGVKADFFEFGFAYVLL